MPKKKVSRNSFYYFMIAFRDEQQKLGINYPNLEVVAEEAGPRWKSLLPNARQKYEEMAKRYKTNGGKVQKFTTLGESFDHLDRRVAEKHDAEVQELSTIKQTIKKAVRSQTIRSEIFFVMDVNTYCYCESRDLHVFNEIAIVAFSLEHGIIEIFHKIVDPGSIPVGYASDAKMSFDVHNFPLPPMDGLGETDYVQILTGIMAFIRDLSETGPDETFPPIYAMPNAIPVIRNTLEQLCDRAGVDPFMFPVYNLPKFYFHLKQELAREDADALPRESLAELQFTNDQFMYIRGMGCDFHEELDIFYNCSKARVSRLVYIVMDNCCRLVDVKLVAGRHVPDSVNVELVVTEPEPTTPSFRAAPMPAKPNPWRTLPVDDDEFVPSPASGPLPGPWRPKPVAAISSQPTLRRPTSTSVLMREAPRLVQDDFPVLVAGRGRGVARGTNLDEKIAKLKMGR